MQYMLYVLFFQFIIFYNQCNISKALIGINVRTVNVGEMSMAVSIAYIPETESSSSTITNHVCTGTVISRQDILTAAHCLQAYKLGEVRVLGGSFDLRYSTSYSPFWWINYNEWANMFDVEHNYQQNDIAVIRLRNLLATGIQIGILTNLTSSLLGNRRVKITGWSYQNDVLNMQQQKGSLDILSVEECDLALSTLTGATIFTDERIICSRADPPILAENGDSGAPTLINDVVVALVTGVCPISSGYGVPVNMLISVHYYKSYIDFLLSM